MSEETENQTSAAPVENSGEQFSPGFLEAMASTKRALEGAGEGNNTYSERSGSESSFNIEEAISNQSSGVQQPTGAPESRETTQGLESGATDAGLDGQAQGGNKTEPTQSEQSLEAAKPIGVSSQMTGDINLEEKPAEGSESETQQPSFEFGDDFKKHLATISPDLNVDNFAAELPKLIQASKDYETVNSQVQNFRTVFENMPPDLYEAVEAWGNGQDYRSVIAQGNKIDFGKSFEDHGNQEMVNNFFEGKISQEEWEEFSDKDGDDDVKAKVANYIDMAKDKYDIAKGKFEHEKNIYEANSVKFTEQRQAAFDASRGDFPKRFEGKLPIQESYVQEVDKAVQNKDSVLAMFFNPDGTHKSDAHARMAMAMGGEELVLSQANALKNKLVSEARAEVIRTTPDSHQIKKTADTGSMSDMQLAEQRAKQKAEDILGKPKQQTY